MLHAFNLSMIVVVLMVMVMVVVCLCFVFYLSLFYTISRNNCNTTIGAITILSLPKCIRYPYFIFSSPHCVSG